MEKEKQKTQNMISDLRDKERFLTKLKLESDVVDCKNIEIGRKVQTALTSPPRKSLGPSLITSMKK